MADKIFHIDILSIDKAVYRGEITSLVVPAELGYMGILADHAPLAANITGGKITLRDSAGRPEVFRSDGGGFMEVMKNNVTLFLSGVRR